MKRLHFCLALALLAASVAHAGPYHPADDGIAGFVGGDVNPVFTGWASYVVEYVPFDPPGSDSITPGWGGLSWDDPTKTLGPVTGSNVDIASLGDMPQTDIDAWLLEPGTNPGPGWITLGFDVAIMDGLGRDFAVFENGFGSGGGIFAEFGYVEVSSNGTDFARFPSVSLTGAAVGGFGTVDQTDVYNLAGKHQNAYGTSIGTGFDLAELQSDQLVLDGLVDLDYISYVRIVDIPGSGDFLDSRGNPIYDSWVTVGSGGVDLEAVGVINSVPVPIPEPATLTLLGLGIAGLAARRMRRK